MAITPGYKSSTEATEVEESYIDKGAVMTPQINPVTDARYAKAKVDADRIDYVEWPTKVSGQENQGM